MAIPGGPYVKGEVERLVERLRDVASLLYDLDQSSSLAVLGNVEDYEGRTREVLADVATDRAWLWPVYTATREEVDRATQHVDRKEWDEARLVIAHPLGLAEAPPHQDLVELVGLIAETAKAVLDVATIVAPKIGEHLGVLTECRSELGRLDEQAAMLGLSLHPTMTAARGAVEDALEQVTKDPLGTDPTIARAAVDRAELLVDDQRARLDALPGNLDQADREVVELELLVQRGREALLEARAKVDQPAGLLRPVDPAVLHEAPRGLRPWLDRLVQAHGEGDVRAALVGMESWQRTAKQVREQAERVAKANEAPVSRRDELRGLLTALRAKASASGLAEDTSAQALYDAARELLWIAPCPLTDAEKRVDEYRRYLASH